MRRAFRLAIWIFAAFTATIVPVFAQNAQVSGKVTDPSGAAVPHVKIRVTNPGCDCKKCAHPDVCDCCAGQDLELESDSSGSFNVTVAPGRHVFTVEKPGFGRQQSAVDLKEGETKELHITLGRGVAHHR
jgi:Carboxypeptidase regulatory-like domain